MVILIAAKGTDTNYNILDIDDEWHKLLLSFEGKAGPASGACSSDRSTATGEVKVLTRRAAAAAAAAAATGPSSGFQAQQTPDLEEEVDDKEELLISNAASAQLSTLEPLDLDILAGTHAHFKEVPTDSGSSGHPSTATPKVPEVQRYHKNMKLSLTLDYKRAVDIINNCLEEDPVSEWNQIRSLGDSMAAKRARLA